LRRRHRFPQGAAPCTGSDAGYLFTDPAVPVPIRASEAKAMSDTPDPRRSYPLLIDGELVSGGAKLAAVKGPYDGATVGLAGAATKGDVTRAIDAAARAAPEARALPSYKRAEALERVHAGATARREELATLLALEAGKPIAQARIELDRMLFIFRDAAAEAMRIGGEVIPLDRMPHGTGRWGITRRFPLGPIAGIVPFNFPLLLTAHKIAPAMACGATIVVKTPPQDPLCVLLLGEILRDAGYPRGGVNVVQCSVDDAAPLLDDPRVRMITFTGSARAGWAIREKAARKKVVLELGGNAGVIVEADADLDRAAARCAAGGFGFAGQSCISVQRILVQRTVFAAFAAKLVARVKALKVGAPLDERADLGSMIDEAAAVRAEAWIREAVAAGARLATGGGRTGSVLEPTVLLDTTSGMKVNCEEVFAPVVTVRPYDDFTAALATVNDSPYGLQAGVFTASVQRAWQAFETLEVGGVAVNDISGFRVDHMPYGGVKQSGLGREGMRYAIEEMTELRLLML
jgi:acyl-CoA reductase-like NAD-dependent aldehyde dehydrogenase